mmetsp:Transcript_67049/g.216194  ORF Transcript_67049/g.216194 Transcript_67049/m.216194 type:complete len:235 (+) Transcript_67049:182-886(+)
MRFASASQCACQRCSAFASRWPWSRWRRCSSAMSARTLASTASSTRSVRLFSVSCGSTFSSSFLSLFALPLALALGETGCAGGGAFATALRPLYFTFGGRARFSTYVETASRSCSCASARSSVRSSCALKMGWRSLWRTLMNSWVRSLRMRSCRCISALTSRISFSSAACLRATRASRCCQAASRLACASSSACCSSSSAWRLAASSASFFSWASRIFLAFSASSTRQRSRSRR